MSEHFSILIGMAATFKDVICVLGLFLLCFLGIPIRVDEPDSMEQEFKQFIEKHNKSYGKDPKEYGKRLSFFKASHIRAKEYNIKHNLNNSQHASFGITKFSDLDSSEFQEILLKHKPSPLSCFLGSNLNHIFKNRRKRDILNAKMNSKPLPSYVDWRQKNVVTAVKNQHNCGACWAFSTVQTIESMLAIAKGELKELSTQQVIDCARNGNQGCTGGDTCTALTWMSSSNVSLLEEKQYPLTLKDQRCKTVFAGSTSPGVHLTSNFTCYNLVDNEEQLKNILAFHGPVTAAVDAVTWQDYLGGIIQFNCRDHTNHAVQIVGYDTRGPIPYYIVRNSWGLDFGNQGYLQIKIGKNLCGIAREVSALDVVA